MLAIIHRYKHYLGAFAFFVIFFAVFFSPVLVKGHAPFHFGPSSYVSGGRGGIRTHERREPLPVFKTGALNHSATLPI
jgi:hypothetical protein